MNLQPRTAFPTGEDLLAALVQLDHEVRTSLTTMMWATDLLGGTPLTREQQSYVDSLRRANAKLLAMLDGSAGSLTMIGGSDTILERYMQPSDEPALPGETAENGAEGLVLDILMAEDTPDVRLLFASFLKSTPHRLEFAQNGAEAVDLCTRKRFDLVIMDVQMPVMDGCEATRAIRAHETEAGHRPVPILALTAQAAQDDVRKCLEAGCTSHLAKPIRKADLLRAVGELSGGARGGGTPPIRL